MGNKEHTASRLCFKGAGLFLGAMCGLIVHLSYAKGIAIETNSNAMAPNFFLGDKVLVEPCQGELSKLRRGDLIVYGVKETDRIHLKRVIGLPGDRVEIRDKVLVINRRPTVKQKLKDVECHLGRLKEEIEAGMSFECFSEGLDGTKYKVLWSKASTIDSEFEAVLVPAGHVFVLGDNRPLTDDSRISGFVSAKAIWGKILK